MEAIEAAHRLMEHCLGARDDAAAMQSIPGWKFDRSAPAWFARALGALKRGLRRNKRRSS